MGYVEVVFFVEANLQDTLLALLSSEPFEGFWQKENQLKAYMPATAWDPEHFASVVETYFPGLRYQLISMPQTNWNAAWEQCYQPVWIDDLCYIRADFHPPAQAHYEILINPKMAFGTGHHPTTSLMIGWQLNIDHMGKRVMDAGCGTAILSIMAEKRGAAAVDAFDIDEWAVENARENVYLNHCHRVCVQKGTINSLQLPQAAYDLILANINRNVLLEEMPAYAKHLKPGGSLLLSGFLKDDLTLLEQAVCREGMQVIGVREAQNWLSIHVRKEI